jgi:hypothetical protein
MFLPQLGRHSSQGISPLREDQRPNEALDRERTLDGLRPTATLLPALLALTVLACHDPSVADPDASAFPSSVPPLALREDPL